MKIFTPELGDRICAELAGGTSIRKICKQEWAPSRRVIYNWLREYPEFQALYRCAQLDGAHAWADEALEIADNGSNDWMADNDPDNPGYKLNGEHVQRSKLRVETRKWYAGRMNPKTYGDKLAVGGAEDLPPVSVQKIERAVIHANSANRDG